MSNKTVKKKKYEEKAPAGIIFSIIAAGIIPLIMRTYTYDSHLASYEWFPSDGTVVDVFLAYKSFAIITVGILMVLGLIYKAYDHEKFPVSKLFYCLFAYAALVLVSGIASKWKGFAFGGSYEMFESVLVVLCYVLFCYYTFIEVKNETTVRTLLKWVGIFSLILMLIGVFQGFGLDLFSTNFGKALFATPSFWGHFDNLVIQMEKGMSYSTIYNPNYFSLYLSLIVPLSICSILSTKDRQSRIIASMVIVCGIILLATDHSITGIAAVVIAAIITVVILTSRNQHCFIKLLTVIIVIAVIMVVAIVSSGTVRDKLKGALTADDERQLVIGNLKDIETNKGDLTFIFKDNTKCHITFDFDDSNNLNVTATNQDGNGLLALWNDSKTGINVYDGAGNLLMTFFPVTTDDGQTNYVNCLASLTDFYFIKDDQGYHYITGSGKVVDLDNNIKTANIFSNDFFSYRGLIWNHTIPLLPKHIILGSGQNTFIMEYPQNNYVQKSLLYGGESTTIDVKPHNLYLQQWVENGMIAMILYIIVVFGFLAQTAGLIRKGDLHDWKTILEIGIFAGILAHSVAGIANDSNVCTSPVMWVMLGLGFAINEMQRKELALAAEKVQKEHEKELKRHK